MIKQLLLAIFLGLGAIIAYLPYDPFIQKTIFDGFKQAFEQALECSLDARLDYINLIRPTIALKQVTVTPCANAKGWQWQADTYIMHCSWWHLLWHGSIDLHVYLKNVVARTDLVEGNLAMLGHMQKMAIGDPNVPMIVTAIDLDRATFTIIDPHKKQEYALTWRSKTQRNKAILHSSLEFMHCALALHDARYSCDLQGSIDCDVIEKKVGMPEIRMKTACKGILKDLLDQPLECLLSAQCDTQKDAHCKGAVTIRTPALGCLGGEWDVDLNAMSARLQLINDAELRLPGLQYHLQPNACMLKMHADIAQGLQGDYHIAVTHADQQLSLCGTIALNAQGLQLKGDVDSAQLASFAPIPADILMKGIVHYGITINDGTNIIASCNLENGLVHLPGIYHCITGCQANLLLQPAAKKLIIQEAQLLLQEGSIVCANGVIHADNGAIVNVHLPLAIDALSINLKPMLDAQFSGNILMQYQKDTMPRIQGHMFLDHALIEPDIVSIDFLKTVSALWAQRNQKTVQIPLDVQCDITLETKKPVHIDTALFQSDIQLVLHVFNTLSNPLVQGSINCMHGIVYLPYKPLAITRGSLHLSPGNLDNPAIELFAQSSIKNHDVMLQITGTLKDYGISVWSNPVLSHKEIAALLAVGDPEAPLSALVPAVATQTIKNIFCTSDIFGLANNSIAQTILKPLRIVHLTPYFDNQIARGGIRAAFEIEYGDHIRALIQKNFTLTEDTRFELEYAISDEVKVRGIRDERRDVNAEVEMRWKF
jgi:hypothetical protein